MEPDLKPRELSSTVLDEYMEKTVGTAAASPQLSAPESNYLDDCEPLTPDERSSPKGVVVEALQQGKVTRVSQVAQSQVIGQDSGPGQQQPTAGQAAAAPSQQQDYASRAMVLFGTPSGTRRSHGSRPAGGGQEQVGRRQHVQQGFRFVPWARPAARASLSMMWNMRQESRERSYSPTPSGTFRMEEECGRVAQIVRSIENGRRYMLIEID